MTQRRRSEDDGSSAVEFALILPLFLLLVLGMVDFGRAYEMQLTLTNAAREGVRVVALREPGTDATQATRNAVAGSGIDPATVGVVSVNCPTGALPATAPDAQVTATKTFTFITPGLGALANLAKGSGGSTLGTPFAITGKAVMRCGG